MSEPIGRMISIPFYLYICNGVIDNTWCGCMCILHATLEP